MEEPAMINSSAVDQRETVTLIGSDKVEGTPVYRPNGERVGTIQRVMIDKIGGQVAYAVMSFGGFMGIGEDYYPLPWRLLAYNPELGGYQVHIGEAQLKDAPKYSSHESWDWADRARAARVDAFYGLAPLT
jgi:hypothetical protein